MSRRIFFGAATSSSSGGGGPTPTNSRLLCQFNGADTSTTFTDDSTYANTMTAQGNAQISTAQSKFGGSSLLLDGTGDWVKIPNSSEFNFGTGDLTVEGWIYLTTSITATNYNIFGFDTAAGPVQFYYAGNTDVFAIYANASNILIGSTASISADTWYHVAFVREGNTWTIYVEGVAKGTTTDSRSLGDPNHANDIGIGAEVTTPSQYVKGYMDSFRVTKGVAVYTGAFTPSGPLVNV